MCCAHTGVLGPRNTSENGCLVPAGRGRRLSTAISTTSSVSDPARIDLYRALDRLPRRQRDIVVLRHLADLSEADVAALIGCSVGTVKSNASRARAALREVLTIEEDR